MNRPHNRLQLLSAPGTENRASVRACRQAGESEHTRNVFLTPALTLTLSINLLMECKLKWGILI